MPLEPLTRRKASAEEKLTPTGPSDAVLAMMKNGPCVVVTSVCWPNGVPKPSDVRGLAGMPSAKDFCCEQEERGRRVLYVREGSLGYKEADIDMSVVVTEVPQESARAARAYAEWLAESAPEVRQRAGHGDVVEIEVFAGGR